MTNMPLNGHKLADLARNCRRILSVSVQALHRLWQSVPPRAKTALAVVVVFAIVLLTLRSCRNRPRHDNASRYDAIIEAAAERYALSPALVKAVIWKESRFDPLAEGRDSEVGLMQIRPVVVTDWCRLRHQPRPGRDLLFTPRLNIEIGTWYLGQAMRHWREYRSADILALAQYNAGGSRARDWAPADPQQEVRPEDIRFSSTRDYIKQVKDKWHEYEKERSSRG